MPFLYGLVYRVLSKSNEIEANTPVNSDDQITAEFDNDDEEGLNMEEVKYGHLLFSEMRATHRFKSVSSI
jgi:hypothetical protein